ncbi:hypothetical protein V2G26_003956 [Clonostachys chloroleuca]
MSVDWGETNKSCTGDDQLIKRLVAAAGVLPCPALPCVPGGRRDPYHAVGASQDEPYLTLTEEMVEMSDHEQIMPVKGSMSRTRLATLYHSEIAAGQLGPVS